MRAHSPHPGGGEARQDPRPAPRVAATAGDALSADRAVRLQREVGNTALTRMLRGADGAPDPPRVAAGRGGLAGDLLRVARGRRDGGATPVQRVPTRPQAKAGSSYAHDRRQRSEPVNNARRAIESQIVSDGSKPAGSAPHVDPAGYAYIRQLKLAKFWIRFHLVNEKAGGDGGSGNLVPASQRDNRNYEIQFEAALKQDVATAAANPGDRVFYGVSVNYPPANQVGTQRQQDNQQFFPTSLNVHHEYYSAANDQWTTRHNGTTFTFQDPQPTDLGANAIPIVTLTLPQLQTIAPGYNWTAADLAFLATLGGANKAEFERYLEEGGGLGPSGAAEHALNEIKYQAPGAPTARPRRAAAPQGTIPFAARINNQQAVRNLADALARGEITL
ncbi:MULTISPECIES: DNA/RNA non-specific endonuclease [Actinosynnema]|uniref:DNA/RNA non-specific endonuclease n=1 Tax=Actinosynnema TaxID=40566 RepID=UPI0020A4D0FA|nr:DNA/RNA non-specific endonuclease [Actinosynnema pretiosum]MCP2098748.1 hypothetical protein [Actinosynnema pretiosum]